ncbi:MAG: M48 family metalloprotease [Zetaproteobacteria bacterium]|nr:M48 family metalloprotease [Zetaproteobacteria bacterium]
MKYRFLWLLLVLLPACATNPATKGHDFVLMSEKEELNLGKQLNIQYHQQLPLLDAKDPLSVYVSEVGQKLAKISDRPDLFYHFYVVDDGTVNAFALPGGYVYIHRGLLNYLNSEAELAAVLGHEIGHVTARHAVKRYTQVQAYQVGMMMASIFVPIQPVTGNLSNLLAATFISGFGREQELQSDELALKYMPKAGYDPHAVASLLSTLKRLEDLDKKEKKDAGYKVQEYHGAFASHPETKKRIADVEAQEQRLHQQGFINHDRFLAAIDGYPYGDSPKDGAVVGQGFFHPKLHLQLKFPKRWVLKNTPRALTARVRKEKAYFRLDIEAMVKRQTPQAFLQEMFRKQDITYMKKDQILGHEAAHAHIEGKAPNMKYAAMDVTIWMVKEQAFIMMMWAKKDKFSQYEKDFNAIGLSLKAFHPKKDEGIPRMALHIWEQGDSWQSLAKQSHDILGHFTADHLAVLNGMDVKQMPTVGVLVKIVK